MAGRLGHLYLRVRHAAHPGFRTREAEIYHELDVAPWEAVLGAEIVAPTLERPIKLRLPPGTENGQQLSPVTDRESGAHSFNDEALHTLRRLEHLRTYCEMNLSGLKLVLSLLEEVERLRGDLRSRR